MRRAAAQEDDLVRRFDAGEDLSDEFDFEHPTFPNREVRRVNVDFPIWMIEALDDEASRIGVNRQAVIKTWIADRIDRRAAAI